jgi:hypothetical protein
MTDSPHEWTDEHAAAHLRTTFEQNARMFPDALESWLPRLEGLSGDEAVNLMRRALARTIDERYPMKGYAP